MDKLQPYLFLFRLPISSTKTVWPETMPRLTRRLFQDTADQTQVRGGEREPKRSHCPDDILFRFGKLPQPKVSLSDFAIPVPKTQLFHGIQIGQLEYFLKELNGLRIRKIPQGLIARFLQILN